MGIKLDDDVCLGGVLVGGRFDKLVVETESGKNQEFGRGAIKVAEARRQGREAGERTEFAARGAAAHRAGRLGRGRRESEAEERQARERGAEAVRGVTGTAPGRSGSVMMCRSRMGRVRPTRSSECHAWASKTRLTLWDRMNLERRVAGAIVLSGAVPLMPICALINPLQIRHLRPNTYIRPASEC